MLLSGSTTTVSCNPAKHVFYVLRLNLGFLFLRLFSGGSGYVFSIGFSCLKKKIHMKICCAISYEHSLEDVLAVELDGIESSWRQTEVFPRLYGLERGFVNPNCKLLTMMLDSWKKQWEISNLFKINLSYFKWVQISFNQGSSFKYSPSTETASNTGEISQT